MVSTSAKGTRRDQRIVNHAADDPAGRGIPDRGKVIRTLKANQAKPARDVLKALHRLIRCCTVGCRNTGQGRIDFGETVRCTTCRLRITSEKKIHAGSMMRVISQKNRYQCRCIEENGQLKRSEGREIALKPNRLQRVVDHRSRKGLSSAEDRDAMFFD